MDKQHPAAETVPSDPEHLPLDPELLRKLGQSVVAYGRGGIVNAYRYGGSIYYTNGDYLGSDPDSRSAKK